MHNGLATAKAVKDYGKKRAIPTQLHPTERYEIHYSEIRNLTKRKLGFMVYFSAIPIYRHPKLLCPVNAAMLKSASWRN